MTPETIVAQVFGHLAAEIRDDTSAESVDAWDSLGHVTLIIELESAFGVSFAPEETIAMTNVAAIKQVLESRGVRW